MRAWQSPRRRSRAFAELLVVALGLAAALAGVLAAAAWGIALALHHVASG